MTERPSAIVAGQLVLTRRGAGMLLAALQLAMKHAERDAVSYQGRSQWDDVSWLREQARLVAEGRTGPASADSADGTVPVPFRVTLPGSEVIWGTRQAAELAGVTRRAVVAAIRRGDLPATRVGREWVVRELEARQYAGPNGRGVDHTGTEARPGSAAGREDQRRPGRGRGRGGRGRPDPPSQP